MKKIIYLLAFISFQAQADIQAELQRYMDIVDDTCMDTYCGGDFNYYRPSLRFDESTEVFTMTFYAEEWGSDRLLPQYISVLQDNADTLNEQAWMLMNQGIQYQNDFTLDPRFAVEVIDPTLQINSINIQESYWEKKNIAYVAEFSCQFKLSSLLPFVLADQSKVSYLNSFGYFLELVANDCVASFSHQIYVFNALRGL